MSDECVFVLPLVGPSCSPGLLPDYSVMEDSLKWWTPWRNLCVHPIPTKSAAKDSPILRYRYELHTRSVDGIPQPTQIGLTIPPESNPGWKYQFPTLKGGDPQEALKGAGGKEDESNSWVQHQNVLVLK